MITFLVVLVFLAWLGVSILMFCIIRMATLSDIRHREVIRDLESQNENPLQVLPTANRQERDELPHSFQA